MREPATIVALKCVKFKNGISTSFEKKGISPGIVKNQYPSLSKRGSANGAANENKNVKRTSAGLLILTKRKNTVRIYHSAFVFGIKPRIAPIQTAWAIAPG